MAGSRHPDDLTFIRPDPKIHREAVFDLIAKVFAGREYWGMLAYCRNSYIDTSHYDWRGSTIGLLGDDVVTHWGVLGYRMRIGRARVRTAGVGVVATHGEHRRKGLMAATARAGCQAARAAGYDVSVLFGIPDFYHRFGYVRAWPERTYTVQADTLPPAPGPMTLRPFATRHRDDLATLYNRCNRRFTKGWEGYLWSAPDGRPAGYVIVTDRQGKRFELVEHAGDSAAVLAALGRLARKYRAREVRLYSLHHDSDLARTLRRGDCRVETHYLRSGEAMIRTLNLPATLRKMRGELAARLRRSHLADWRGEMLIADAREKVLLAIDRSRVAVRPAKRTKHAIRGGDEIAQLLIGTGAPRETVAAGTIRLTGDAKRLVDVLFPDQHPSLAAWDHF